MSNKNQNTMNIWDLNAKFWNVKVKELNWQWRGVRISEADLRGGMKIEMEFPDAEGVLESTVEDLKYFCKLGGIKILKRDGYPVICRFGRVSKHESYRISVNTTECLLEAADTEGIRRGMYYLMSEMMLSGGPFLKLGEVERNAIVENRIVHGYPLNAFDDELGTGPERRPEEYLSMLARDAVNGFLLTVDLKKLTGKFKAYTDKLSAVVDQCRRYGIKVYLFCTEPISFEADCPIFKDFPELAPAEAYSSPEAREKLAHLMGRTFSKVPALGGVFFRSLKDGYKIANCAKAGNNSWKTAAQTLELISEAVEQASPNATVAFWPYEEIFWRGIDNQLKGANQMPRGIVQMRNLESFGSKQQMGKKRVVADNWLSYIGPSPYFKACAKRSRKAGDPLYAMLPLGSSPEIGTVRNIPVPSNYYRKYRAMRSLGVSGVVQSWEMGMYPSEMTHAAGILAFEPFPATEDIFLNKLARMYWDEKNATEIVAAWKHFSQAFNHYPLCHAFREAGPLQDGIAWKLNLLPGGEDDFARRIEACLEDCDFNLEEVTKLLTKLARRWAVGVRIMTKQVKHFRKSPERMREIAVMEALGLLFDAGNDIFKFYELRCQLFAGAGPDRLLKLKQLRKLVRNQIEYSRRMLLVIERDHTIGFHFGEGVFRFNAEMLHERIASLKLMLQKEFPVMEKRLKSGLPAMED